MSNLYIKVSATEGIDPLTVQKEMILLAKKLEVNVCAQIGDSLDTAFANGGFLIQPYSDTQETTT
jgi:hypothetical protein